MNTPIIKVMYRAQCFAAAAGYGSEYDVENINIPTLIISISSMDTKVPNILERHKKENKNIISVIKSIFLAEDIVQIDMYIAQCSTNLLSVDISIKKS